MGRAALARALGALLQLGLRTFGAPRALPLAVVFLLVRAQRDGIVQHRVREAAAMGDDDDGAEGAGADEGGEATEPGVKTPQPEDEKRSGGHLTEMVAPRKLLAPLARKLGAEHDCATPRERAFMQQELAACGAEDLLEERDAANALHKRRRVEDAAGDSRGPPRGDAGRTRRRARQQASKGAFAPLESGVLFSQSCLWNTNENFYKASGLDPWTTNQVPCGITSSPFLANRYARVIGDFCAREHRRTASAAPVYVLDLGSGHGTFAVRLARALRDRLGGPGTKARKACVVMTDFHSGVMDRLAMRSDLQELIDQGWLEFAVLDLQRAGPDAYRALKLRARQVVVDLALAPVIAVCNYVLDSLPADVLAVNDAGRNLIGTCTTWPRRMSNQPGIPSASVVPNTASVELDFVEHYDGESALDDERARAVLRETPPGRTVLLNSGAGRALCCLASVNPDRPTLVLVADKMQDSIHEALAWHAGVPGLDRHGDAGCISCAVDPYVLETFIAADARVHTCVAKHLDDPGQSLGQSVFCLNAASKAEAEELMGRAHEALHAGLTVTDFDRLQGWLLGLGQDEMARLLADLGSEGLAALLALTEYDFEIFWALKWMMNKASFGHGDAACVKLAIKCFEQRFPLDPVSNVREVSEMSQWCTMQNHPEPARALMLGLSNTSWYTTPTPPSMSK